jgi:hypothetical protein
MARCSANNSRLRALPRVSSGADHKFSTIRISSVTDKLVESITMHCADILAILEGNYQCKVFNGAVPGADAGVYSLGYNCSDGKVSGPRND